MNTETTNNRLFTDAIVGVLLVLGAFALTLLSIAYIKVFLLPYALTVALMAGSGIYLLYRAIKNDKYRLSKS